MADRKVLNKYYPPDYDPSHIPRLRASKQRQIQSRIMLPMSVQCTQCGEFVYKGKKFNARKEYVAGADYLGIKRWRFYFRCPSCLQEMTFKTDPQHGGYEVEKGARRNVEPWRDQQREVEEARAEREAEEQDVMKKLENKSKDGRREHELAEVLEEVRERNGRGEKLTLDELVDWHVRRKQRQEDEEDERRAKEAFNRRMERTRAGESDRPASQQREVDGRLSSLEALDDELTASSSHSTFDALGDECEVDERAQDDRQEEEEEEAKEWTRQRRELTASGLSFGKQQPKGYAAMEADDRKEGPTSHAAIVVVKKRRAQQQLYKNATGSLGSGVEKKQQREVEEGSKLSITTQVMGGAIPTSAALSTLLTGYDDESDAD